MKTLFERISEAMPRHDPPPPPFDHVWYWRSKLGERKGDRCRVLARGTMQSILVEFEDGYTVITGRHAVRRA